MNLQTACSTRSCPQEVADELVYGVFPRPCGEGWGTVLKGPEGGTRVGEGCRGALEGSTAATALPVSIPRRRNGLPPANQVTKPALVQTNLLAPFCAEGPGCKGPCTLSYLVGGVSVYVSG